MDTTRTRTFTRPAAPPLPKGAWFARAAAALALRGPFTAEALAAAQWGEGNAVERILKTAVGPINTTDAAALMDPAVAEVFSAIKETSVLGRLVGARKVPPMTRLVFQSVAGSAGWVKEYAPKPLTKLGYTDGTPLPILKLQSTIAVSKELLLLSSPSAEDWFRTELLNALVREMDSALLDPANNGIAGEKPASIFTGVTPIASAGTPEDDIAALTSAYSGDWTTAHFVASGSTGAALNSISRPDASAKGGSVNGIPLITTHNMDGDLLALIDAGGLAYFAERIGLDQTEASALQMNDAPDNPVTASTVYVSLWQSNLVGLRVEMATNWRAVRPGAVSYVNAIAW